VTRSFALGRKNQQFKQENLSRLLSYILGRRPDEYGIVPDIDGFVSFKELLQAMHEEPDLRYVRKAHINEILMGKDRERFFYDDRRIGMKERNWTMDLVGADRVIVPKILYTPVRRKAHPVVMEKGLKTAPGRYLVLSAEKDMARRIGKRRDPAPVVIEVMAEAAQREDTAFFPFGDLFLSPRVPAKFLFGPPVSKETLEARANAISQKESSKIKPEQFTPGSFPLDISRDPDAARRNKGKKPRGWKEAARKSRRKERS
jgi:putative RNA 2'-phosphotransferase